MLALALLGQAATSLADGRDVLADAQDNGTIDGCYSREEFEQALALARGDERLYGVSIDVIKAARITRVERPGVPCGSAPGAGVAAVEDRSGGSLPVWIGVVAAVGVVAVGAGAWAGRGRERG